MDERAVLVDKNEVVESSNSQADPWIDLALLILAYFVLSATIYFQSVFQAYVLAPKSFQIALIISALVIAPWVFAAILRNKTNKYSSRSAIMWFITLCVILGIILSIKWFFLETCSGLACINILMTPIFGVAIMLISAFFAWFSAQGKITGVKFRTLIIIFIICFAILAGFFYYDGRTCQFETSQLTECLGYRAAAEKDASLCSDTKRETFSSVCEGLIGSVIFKMGFEADACGEFSDIDIKGACYLKFATASGDFLVCDNIQSVDVRDDCYRRFMNPYDRYHSCRREIIEKMSDGNIRNIEISNLARDSGDEKICELIPENRREYCLRSSEEYIQKCFGVECEQRLNKSCAEAKKEKIELE